MAGGRYSTIEGSHHLPVLSREVVRFLAPQDGEVIVDGTFGAGGHTRQLLNTANCHIIGIDQDPNVRVFADAIKSDFPDRFTFIPGRFGAMQELLHAQGLGESQPQGVLLDIGVSSMQIDEAERGFSFMQDGPLDMRMGGTGSSAETLVNQCEESELAGIIFKYGDERKSRAIAKAIIAARAQSPITRTKQLADIVVKAVRGYKDTIHPATRTFQAIRIHVNDELSQLEEGLLAAEALLAPQGRLAVITFHSGEDSVVKRFFETRSGKGKSVSRYLPEPVNDNRQPSFSLVTRKAVAAAEDEVNENPRARSAKLRVAQRTDAPIWQADARMQGGVR